MNHSESMPRANSAPQGHPRYAEYMRYQSTLRNQLVAAQPFDAWLEQAERFENAHRTVYFCQGGANARYEQGWYWHEFPANSNNPLPPHGPFNTKPEACADAGVPLD